ncbi:MAG: alpha/beta fold hydrolase [Ramlibacter sp.]|nr:alpha/beta fold hydrolase [Ramlibacter sp.]
MIFGVLAATVLALYVLSCIAVYVWADRLIFQPDREVYMTPADCGVAFRDVFIPLQGSESLHGWFHQARDGAPSVLFLHGTCGNMSENIAHFRRLSCLGVSVLMVDYRGYGASSGLRPSEREMKEDAVAAWKFLHEVAPASTSRFVFGRSLGASVALGALPKLDIVSGVILECPFTSILDVVRLNKLSYLFPFSFLIRTKFNTYQAAAHVTRPVLLIHGTKDSLIPSDMSKALLAQLVNGKLVLVSGAGHDNVALIGAKDYLEEISDFMDICTRSKPEASRILHDVVDG